MAPSKKGATARRTRSRTRAAAAAAAASASVPGGADDAVVPPAPPPPPPPPSFCEQLRESHERLRGLARARVLHTVHGAGRVSELANPLLYTFAPPDAYSEISIEQFYDDDELMARVRRDLLLEAPCSVCAAASRVCVIECRRRFLERPILQDLLAHVYAAVEYNHHRSDSTARMWNEPARLHAAGKGPVYMQRLRHESRLRSSSDAVRLRADGSDGGATNDDDDDDDDDDADESDEDEDDESSAEEGAPPRRHQGTPTPIAVDALLLAMNACVHLARVSSRGVLFLSTDGEDPRRAMCVCSHGMEPMLRRCAAGSTFRTPPSELMRERSDRRFERRLLSWIDADECKRSSEQQ